MLKIAKGRPQNAPWETGTVKMIKNNQKRSTPWQEMGSVFDKHRHKTKNKNIEKPMDFDTKVVPKGIPPSMPKVMQHQCQNRQRQLL